MKIIVLDWCPEIELLMVPSKMTWRRMHSSQNNNSPHKVSSSTMETVLRRTSKPLKLYRWPKDHKTQKGIQNHISTSKIKRSWTRREKTAAAPKMKFRAKSKNLTWNETNKCYLSNLRWLISKLYIAYICPHFFSAFPQLALASF